MHSSVLTVAVDDVPPVQVQQPCTRIDGHAQPPAPRQLGGSRWLITACHQAVVQAAPAAVLCTVSTDTSPIG